MVIDSSPITDNSWLAGFIDADANFNIIIAPRKNTETIRIQAQFRIELCQTYKRSVLNGVMGTTYWDIQSIIANYLGVNVYNRARLLKDSMTYQYFFVAGSKRSQLLIIDYLNKFPLFSTKYNDYLDWCKIIDLNNNKQMKKDIVNKANIIKSGINSKRTNFPFDHLKNFPLS